MPPTHTQLPVRELRLHFASLLGEEAPTHKALIPSLQELPTLPSSHPTRWHCLSPSLVPAVEQSTAMPWGLTEEVPLRMLPRATRCRWISTRLSMSSSSSSCKGRDKLTVWGAGGHSQPDTWLLQLAAISRAL